MICFLLFIEEFASYDLSVKRHVAELSEHEHSNSCETEQVRKIKKYSRSTEKTSRSTNFKIDRLNPSSQTLKCLNTSLHIISFSSVHPVSSI
ncbi:hypothetical protein KSS87_018228, partial [Heliosperma pusillum]